MLSLGTVLSWLSCRCSADVICVLSLLEASKYPFDWPAKTTKGDSRSQSERSLLSVFLYTDVLHRALCDREDQPSLWACVHMPMLLHLLSAREFVHVGVSGKYLGGKLAVAGLLGKAAAQCRPTHSKLLQA